MNASANNNRLDYLDAVRAFALLLGILFHTSMSFMPIFIGWAVMDISTSPFVSNFALVSHSFRMELFFLIAGFFSHMTFHRNGTRRFIKSRIFRIAMPLVIGWFILKPLIVASWTMGNESLRGEVNILNGLKAGVLSLEHLSTDFLTGSHLWFLYYLLVITALTLLLRVVTCQTSRLHAKLTSFVDPLFVWTVNSRLSWFILSVPTSICLWKMSFWGMDTPDKSLAPHWPVLFVYTGFFLFGWLLHRLDELMPEFARLSIRRFALCISAIVSTTLLSRFQADMGHPHIGWIHAGFNYSYALMMWSLVSLSVGVFQRFFDKPNPIVRYLADSSYWLYLVHLPIVVWLQIAVAELSFHWSLKLAAVSFLTVGLSLVLYDLFVRSTWIGKILNGRRMNRALFRWRSSKTTQCKTEMSRPAVESC